MDGSIPATPAANLLLLRAVRAGDSQPLAILTPSPPKRPDALPRYGCSGCGELLLAGVSLAEVKERTGRAELAVRCPGCDALNLAEVSPGPSRSSLRRPGVGTSRRRTQLADWSRSR
jgi:hypothetical protein